MPVFIVKDTGKNTCFSSKYANHLKCYVKSKSKYKVSQKMCLSLIERKLRISSPIFKILAFLNKGFSNLNFDVLLFIIRFI